MMTDSKYHRCYKMAGFLWTGSGVFIQTHPCHGAFWRAITGSPEWPDIKIYFHASVPHSFFCWSQTHLLTFTTADFSSILIIQVQFDPGCLQGPKSPTLPAAEHSLDSHVWQNLCHKTPRFAGTGDENTSVLSPPTQPAWQRRNPGNNISVNTSPLQPKVCTGEGFFVLLDRVEGGQILGGISISALSHKVSGELQTSIKPKLSMGTEQENKWGTMESFWAHTYCGNENKWSLNGDIEKETQPSVEQRKQRSISAVIVIIKHEKPSQMVTLIGVREGGEQHI